ncbi:MAG TPA: vWA domain-containing protein [Acidimicrobiia bacterium]|jgi:Mg-chelatase subunit ChlD|nr:vWA domain-containing protein [Acidimicrobiia bacterium]
MTNKVALSLIAAAAILTSCAGPSSTERSATGPSTGRSTTPTTMAPADPGGGWLGGDADRGWGDSGSGGSGDRAVAEEASSMPASTTASASSKSAKPAAGVAAPTPGVPPVTGDVIAPPDRQGPGLRAGSVDDNAAFADYLTYRDQFRRLGIKVHDIDVSVRHVVTVVDEAGQPLLGAVVTEGSQEVRTGPDGRALLFGNIGGFSARWGDKAVTVDFAQDAGREHRVTLPVRRPEGRAKLDVLFLIDTTGSMGDEIDRLKDSVRSVAERISALPANADLRLAMTVYRDRGDLFVTRTFDFTSSVDVFKTALAEVRASGGGDTPEDLNAGLHQAVTGPSWRGDDAVKLIFLIADAPPHLDYQDGPDYADDVLAAARRGIKIMPIASSGLDDQGEYVFRQLAQITMARFTFLTYGADGVSPGDHTDHHVSDYAVLALDDLVVRLVSDELRPLGSGGQ